MRSTHTCDLLLTTFPPEARKAHIFPNSAAGALLSIGVMCDHGCTAHLDKNTITICRKGTIIMHGHRQHPNDLWTIDSTCINQKLPTMNHPPLHTACIATPCPHYSTIAQHVAFLHGAMCFPALSTLCDALDEGFLTSLPEITSKLVRKYPPPSATMVQGHLDQTRQNVGSTQQSPANRPPTQQSPATLAGTRTHNVFASCIPATGSIFTDQTGRLPTRSTAGNSDMLVMYDY